MGNILDEPDHEHIPWIGRLIGLDWLDRRIAARFELIAEQLAANAVDVAALESARSTLRNADTIIDHIEPGENP